MTFKAPKGRYWRLSGRIVPPTSGLKHFFVIVLGRCPRLSQSRPVGPESQKKLTRDESENRCPNTHLAEQKFPTPTFQKSLILRFVAQPRHSLRFIATVS